MRAKILPAALAATLGTALTAGPLAAQACGGDFNAFKSAFVEEAIAKGHDAGAAQRFAAGLRQDSSVIAADRRQGVFQMPFIDFARRLISDNRLQNGLAKSREMDAVLTRAEQEYGVPRGILLAFWAFETDYGAVQGDFNTANALATLAHDCRRPELFRPQLMAALELYEQGLFDPATTTGAWAGEIGMVQMLPEDIIRNGVDADGDGKVSLKTSAPDALLSGAKMLRDLGWRPNEPWLKEVTLPADFDWSRTGLETQASVADWQAAGVRSRAGELPPGAQTSVLLPQGRGGPAFLAYPNFRVLFEWNESFVYVMTAAYFATRLEGAPVFDAGQPAPGLDGAQMKALQEKLVARGYDVGDVDGILGAKTRAAVRDVQAELGLPADAWPTPELLNRL